MNARAGAAVVGSVGAGSGGALRAGAARAEVFVALRRAHDDLRIVGGGGLESSGFTLLALLRNEMYFLPAFLAHYRALGVERFVFLDDRSDDGSREYLLGQRDTVVVESDRRYGDRVQLPPALVGRKKDPRANFLWRSLLHDRFAADRWAVQVDLDEFVQLPPGMTFPDLVSRIDGSARSVWGVMLDVYPKDAATLARHAETARLDTAASWYFDGERHLRLRGSRPPRIVYPGARARLYVRYGVMERYDPIAARLRRVRPGWRDRPTPAVLRKLARVVGRLPLPVEIAKPVMVRWSPDAFFRNSHRTNLPASGGHLLPIQHFRFAGSLGARIGMALRDRSHFRASADYCRLRDLLVAMADRDGSFLYRRSLPFGHFGDARRTGNAKGV